MMCEGLIYVVVMFVGVFVVFIWMILWECCDCVMVDYI